MRSLEGRLANTPRSLDASPMGIPVVYFSCANDSVAWSIETRPCGPLVESGSSKAPCDGFEADDYHPEDVELFTTRLADVDHVMLQADPRWDLTARGRGAARGLEPFVVALTDLTLTAFSQASRDDLMSHLDWWTVQLGGDADSRQANLWFLQQLRTLVIRTHRRSHHLYCYSQH